MKYILKTKILGLLVLVASFVSCDTLREADQEVSDVISAANKVRITSTSSTPADGMLTEGDTISFSVTIDQPIDRSISFSAKLVGGAADDHDISVTPGTIAPFYTSTTVEVVVPADWDVESDEAMQLEFGVYGIAERYLFVEDIEFPVLDFTVKNYVSDIFDLTVEWDQEVEVMEEQEVDLTSDAGNEYTVIDTLKTTVHAADEVDYDFIICPVDGFDIDDPWGSAITWAATGDHPEVFELPLGALPDGNYYLAYDLWSNGIATDYVSIVDSTILLPAMANIVRQGTDLDIDITQLDEQSPNVYTQGGDDNGIGKTGVVAIITVTNGEYSISAYDGAANKSAFIKGEVSRTPSKHEK